MRHGRPGQSRGHLVLGNPDETVSVADEAIPVATQPSAAFDSISEFQVIFDTGGHDHDGIESATVDHADLTNVSENQHHSRLHTVLNSSDHSDTLTGTVVAGDLVIGNATPKWARLAIGSSGQVLTVSGGLPAWSTPASAGSSKGPLGAWGKDNSATLGVTDEEIFNVWTKKADNQVPRILSGAGTLKALCVTMDAVITGGGSVTATAYLNGVATALTITVSTEQNKTATGSVAFAAQDLLEVWAKRTGTISNTPSLEVVVEGSYT